MKRTDFLIKLVTLIIFVALVAYIGYSVYDSRENKLRTVAAIEWELNDSIPTEGHIVRDEEILSYSAGNVYVSASEGQKMAAGQAVGVGYLGTGALERAEEVRALRLEIEEFEKVREDKSAEGRAYDSVRNLARVIAAGDLDELDAAALDVEVNIFSDAGNYSAETLDSKIASLQSELDLLLASAGSDMRNITVNEAGIFSAYVDGYESVTPESVMSMTPSELEKSFASGKTVRTDDFGKLISGIKWYYATTVDTKTAKKLEQLGKATLDFSKTYNASITMTVEKIGPVENGRCVAVFSCKNGLHELTAIRDATADIVFSRTSGIRVPKESVHLDEEGNAFVYVLLGVQAEKAAVTVASESGEYYLVQSESSKLGAGSLVIERANDVADGKVVMS